MSAVQLTEEQCKQGVANISPEVQYMREEKGVDAELMGMMGHFGIVDNDTFSAIASDETSLRTMLKNDFGIDADGPISAKVRSAKLINTWRTARERRSRPSRMRRRGPRDVRRRCLGMRSCHSGGLARR